MNEVEELLGGDRKAGARDAIDEAIGQIRLYMGHEIRRCNQEKRIKEMLGALRDRSRNKGRFL